MNKRIIYTQADGRMVVVVPYAGDRRVTLNDDGELLFASQPASRDAIKAELIKVVAENIDKIMPPFNGIKIPVYRAETDDEFIARIRTTPAVTADATNVTIINADQVPSDIRWRDSWRVEAGTIGFDMEKARNLLRDKIRVWRAPQLALLDTSYYKADEALSRAKAAGDATAMASAEALKADIAAQKQVLRDMPADPRIDGAYTINDLAALTDSVFAVIFPRQQMTP